MIYQVWGGIFGSRLSIFQSIDEVLKPEVWLKSILRRFLEVATCISAAYETLVCGFSSGFEVVDGP